ncbi:GH3 auxin-responsive promoter family protein [bacterium]|nr:GH3 auxin-responsive promoter family protein [bacterium]
MNPQAVSLLASLAPWSTAPGDGWTRLRDLLERHADTAFGRAHQFDAITSPETFREMIPPMDYEAHRPWIERAAGGEGGVLACDEILGFERTSGTSSQAKWIPISEGLREEFARGLAAWFCGWQVRRPEVFAGRGYWALSPPGMSPETTPGGLPLGMASDAAYFPGDVGARLADWLVIPELSGRPEAVFDETALALLAAPDLSVVSVWGPTFLLGIDAALRRLRGEFSWREVWPRLALVSCWADASSAPWIPRLRERLGGIPIEAKGLLATEGITSLPDAIDGSPRLAGECHWQEFLDESGTFTEVGELRPGGIYEVLLTTGGGLFRYRSGDRVRVTGFGADRLPRLRFIGRAGAGSDLVGEKLHEAQVLEALAGGCGLLVADAARPGYDLWLEDPAQAAAFEKSLRQNPYFDQALALRQLAPLRVRVLRGDWLFKLSHALAARRGCRLGDVKLPALITGIPTGEVASWLD